MTAVRPASPRLAVALSAAVLFVLIALRLRHLLANDWLLVNEDVDSMLRLSLVESLARGDSGWFHHVIDRMSPPDGVPTPWTRPLDLVLLTLAAPFAPFLGIHKALLVGAAFYGPVCQLAVIALMTGLHRRLGGTLDGSLGVAILLLAYPAMIVYFGPQNADHHALLALSWTVCLILLARDAPLDRRTAILSGSALGVGLWISTEFLAVLAFVHACWALRFLTEREMARRIVPASLATMLVLGFALVVERRHAEWGRVEYDTVALPLIAVGVSACIGWSLLALVERRSTTLEQRGIAIVAIGLPLSLLLIRLFPAILTGPLGQADPYMQTIFLPAIGEMQPLWQSPLLFGATLILVLIITAYYVRRRAVALGRPHGLLLASMLLFFAAATWHQRMIYYVLPPIAVLFALAIENGLPERGRLFALLLIPLLPFGAMAIETPQKVRHSSETPLSYNPECYESLARALVRPQGDWAASLVPTDTIYAPFDLTPLLLFQTPWRYLSGNYHRDVVGYRDSQGFAHAASDAEALAIVRRRGIRLVAVCRAWARPDNYFSRLIAHPPAGYHPVDLGDEMHIAAWLVDR